MSSRERQWQWIRRLFQAALTCLLFTVMAAPAATLTGNWREAHPGDVPADVLLEAYNRPLASFDPARMQVFPASANGTWVILRQLPPWTAGERVLSINTPGLGAVSLYDEHGRAVSTSLEDFGPGVHGHGRLMFSLPASMPASHTILLKFEPTTMPAGAVTLSTSSWADYLRDDSGWVAFATACFAVILTMALMAMCFAAILRDMTFGWYAAYLVCYALIQGVKTGYIFHPLEFESLAGMGDTLGAAATSLSVSFSALFVLRFAKIDDYAPLLRMPVLAFAVGMPVLIVLRATGIEVLVQTAALLLQPLLLIGASLLLVAGAIAAARGSRHAWFFLVGWTPLLLLTALCGAQTQGMLADAPWLPNAAIAFGAFEAIVLSIGLSDRALTIRHDRDRARQLADSDPLTGVHNRRAWTDAALERLEQGLSRPIALLFLDLDHFKELNDRFGHAAGDRALVAVAAALRDELRPSDLLGRFGGEEFVAMLQGVDRENAMQVATRLCRRITRLDAHLGENSEPLTVSIGVALRTPADTLQSLIERADAAMYAAKLAGRNRVVCSGPAGPALVRREGKVAN
ncbi:MULTISPECIES: diguanylate cyclase [Rhodanobacteraceae]|uniref:sensor domain-containing diguanylate cyclase n=1 Tax=Rhodanobacteraceae TaxID=1775411 RepID=UPI00088BEBF9|nr:MULTISPECIES: diguanylate cyclase [Rhodanobacteraceae]SDF15939.1 diguanylate cyclase (GGDEF) domain-containing protein [Dyella sp. 333MFSha]SKB82424.1 diguanylate cyclase (GGDEF) domain-containing protein [Luteibacter sp. 22Crub2.1]